MDLSGYFNPIDIDVWKGGLPKAHSVAGLIQSFGDNGKTPTIGARDIVVIGIPESRNSSNASASFAPNEIRKHLYALSASAVKGNLIDLGNIKHTSKTVDTYIATRDVVNYITGKGATVVILGGTQELTWHAYQGVKELRENIGVSIIDSRVDLGFDESDFGSTCFYDSFLKEPIVSLLNLSVLGYQGYLVAQNHIERLKTANLELVRLGAVRGHFKEVEPILRDSDIVSFDMAAIRQSDCPGVLHPSPNGLYAEEACQLTRYAGLSDRTSVFGIYELATSADPSGQSAHLAAQLVWHFVEGHGQRKGEYPYHRAKELKKFIVGTSTPGVDLVFYRSIVSDNWWVEIPSGIPNLFPDDKITIACSYTDYVAASKQELPDRWMHFYKKLM
ncbi:MAG: arginase family protein [Bacteroidales bacterium]|nr:arginase family protein [Bacteroidales bacterium]MBN2748074.1 arginase family protein [Bacteroidales bacterium]